MTVRGVSAREVRNILREKGLEKGVEYLFEHLIEELTEQKQNLKTVGVNQLQMIDTLGNIVVGVSGMGQQVAKLLNREDHEDGLGASTQGLNGDN